ncbi:MAG: FAD-binding oxidoreductase, partial [Gallionellaceae bacterium]|nr:FAD-binding oxidoreductase [Gallionellaceae bacterium]
MTSFTLLLWILSGIVLQLAIYLGIGFWRHWRNYQTLSESAAESGLTVSLETVHPKPDETPQTAWSGYRSFSVERKVIEDAAQSVCSFYLVPEDAQALPYFLPGQFLTFRLDVPGAAATEQIIRCYSLSDAPRADGYRISVKRAVPPNGCDAPPGRSSNHLHDHVAVGSRLQVRAPSGHFHIDRSDAP